MMKKVLFLLIMFLLAQPVHASSLNAQERAVKNVINSQIKYANKGNVDKFLKTYDLGYVDSDGFDLKIYSELVKEVWSSYKNLKYTIKIKEIKIDGDMAIAYVTEYSDAQMIAVSKNYTGELKSESDRISYLKKVNGKWKVYADEVQDETTTMLYGEAKNLNVKLTVPQAIEPNTEYCTSLEFQTPKNMLAIASITSDKVEYPQKQSKEVFRAMPEDNILERLFTSNSDDKNEYVVASIGLTQTDISDLSIKMSLTGFGYVVRRVNVIPAKSKETVNEQN